MLYFCEYSAVPGTRREVVHRRIITLHHTAGNCQDRIVCWYEFPEELSGFIVCNCESMEELESSLEPYRGLLNFWIRELAGEVNYEARIGLASKYARRPASARQSIGAGAGGGAVKASGQEFGALRWVIERER